FLPGFPLLLVLAAGAARSASGVRTAGRVVLAAIVVIVFGWERSTAQWRGVSPIRRSEHRYVTIGRDLASSTARNAVFLSMQHSGSARYYAERLTVRFDAIPRESLDSALAILRARGFHPYFLLEKWEEPQFRDRFAANSALGRLDWAPARQWTAATPVALYDPDDRPKLSR